MSTEDEISNVENAKLSDRTSTAGEHQVNAPSAAGDEEKKKKNKREVEQADEKSKDVPITVNQKIPEVQSNSEKPNEELTVV